MMEGSEAQDDAWLVPLGMVARVGWLLGKFTLRPLPFSKNSPLFFIQLNIWLR